jgi:uncharacterized membrane protein YoaT (DUF817 family)
MIIFILIIIGVVIYLANNFNNYHSADNSKQRVNDRKYWEDRKRKK